MGGLLKLKMTHLLIVVLTVLIPRSLEASIQQNSTVPLINLNCKSCVTPISEGNNLTDTSGVGGTVASKPPPLGTKWTCPPHLPCKLKNRTNTCCFVKRYGCNYKKVDGDCIDFLNSSNLSGLNDGST